MSFENIGQDLRQSIRALRRDFSFTITALLILAIGIGANTAIFSIANSVLLRPLNYGDADRLVAINEVVPQFARIYPLVPVNGRHVMEWSRNMSSFEGVAMVNALQLNLTGAGEPERVPAASVSANFFSVLDVPAQLGRTFVTEDGQPGKDNVVVLSDSLWRRRFGASRSVLGQAIHLNEAAYTVVGVLPSTFRQYVKAAAALSSNLPPNVDVYKPWFFDESKERWFGQFNYSAVARLREGVTLETAQAEFTTVQAAISRQSDEFASNQVDLDGKLIPLQEEVVGESRRGLLLLLAAVGAVLMVAYLNIGNLMVVRISARSREAAIRSALGASWQQIFRGVFVESLVLAFSGTVLGIGFAFSFLRVFSVVAPIDLPRADEITMDWRALVFALALSVGAALVFSLLPIWRLRRTDPNESLRNGGRSVTESGGTFRLRRLLVAIEVGVSVALLIVAGLLITSFTRLGGVERGFDASNVLTAQISLPTSRYSDNDKRRRFYTDLARALEQQPGIIAAGVTSVLPLNGRDWGDSIIVEGQDVRPIGDTVVEFRSITPDYPYAMGIPLYAGRFIEEKDYPRKVAVVSRLTAAHFWPGQNAIGKRFSTGPADGQFEVVGVIADTHSGSMEKEPDMTAYVPLWELSRESASIALRTDGDSVAAVALLRQTVLSMDRELPLSRIRTMTQIETAAVDQRRFQTLLVVVFAAGALLLSALGIYGVLAYTVTRRHHEIGVRMALGARPIHVMSMVLGQGLRPVMVGLIAGIGGAMMLGRVLSTLLFSVSPMDLRTFAIVTAVTLGAAVLACYLPARRATRVDPMIALRQE